MRRVYLQGRGIACANMGRTVDGILRWIEEILHHEGFPDVLYFVGHTRAFLGWCRTMSARRAPVTHGSPTAYVACAVTMLLVLLLLQPA